MKNVLRMHQQRQPGPLRVRAFLDSVLNDSHELDLDNHMVRLPNAGLQKGSRMEDSLVVLVDSHVELEGGLEDTHVGLEDTPAGLEDILEVLEDTHAGLEDILAELEDTHVEPEHMDSQQEEVAHKEHENHALYLSPFYCPLSPYCHPLSPYCHHLSPYKKTLHHAPLRMKCFGGQDRVDMWCWDKVDTPLYLEDMHLTMTDMHLKVVGTDMSSLDKADIHLCFEEMNQKMAVDIGNLDKEGIHLYLVEVEVDMLRLNEGDRYLYLVEMHLEVVDMWCRDEGGTHLCGKEMYLWAVGDSTDQKDPLLKLLKGNKHQNPLSFRLML